MANRGGCPTVGAARRPRTGTSSACRTDSTTTCGGSHARCTSRSATCAATSAEAWLQSWANSRR
eukprot:73998-Pyramimonas_sp.AAC.1